MSDAAEKECPLKSSMPHFLLMVLMAILGITGLYYLSPWVSLAYIVYFVVFIFVIMPVKMCQNCYYRTKGTIDEWKEKYSADHVQCTKTWGLGMFIVWLVPIAGIIISFFKNFSYIAVICLVGFVVALIASNKHLEKAICTTCELYEACPLRQR
jgi:hypothetical protein